MLLAVDIGNSTISTGLFGLDGELRFWHPWIRTTERRRIRSAWI